MAGTDLSSVKIVKIWDLRTQTLRSDLQGHESSVATLAFTDAGRMLISTGRQEKKLCLWKVANGPAAGALTAFCSLTLKGSKFGKPVVSPRFPLAVGQFALESFACNVETGRSIKIPGKVDAFAFMPNGKEVIVADKEGLQTWDLQSLVDSTEGHGDPAGVPTLTGTLRLKGPQVGVQPMISSSSLRSILFKVQD